MTITSVLKSDYIKSIYTCTYYNTIIVSGLLPKPSAEFTGWELLYLNSEAHSYRIYTLKSQRNKPKLTLLEILMTNMNIDVICALRYWVVSRIPLLASKCLFWKEFANYSWSLWRQMKPLCPLRFVLKMLRAYSKDVSVIFVCIYDVFLHSQQQKMPHL